MSDRRADGSYRLYASWGGYRTTAVEVSSAGTGSYLWHAQATRTGAPCLVDVNDDGAEDLVQWNSSDNLSARDGTTGAILWQAGLVGGERVGAAVYTSRRMSVPVAVDLDDDGTPEILVTTQEGWLYALRTGGDVFFAIDFAADLSHPIVADLSGDGAYAILVAADDGYLYVLMQTGG